VSDAAFRRTAIYQRAVNHPNLKRLLPLIERNARLQSLDPALVKAVVAVESGFDPAAVSPKGAFGLMQLLPETAARYGVVGDTKHSAAQSCSILRSTCAPGHIICTTSSSNSPTTFLSRWRHTMRESRRCCITVRAFRRSRKRGSSSGWSSNSAGCSPRPRRHRRAFG
jgi:hypothetical protein